MRCAFEKAGFFFDARPREAMGGFLRGLFTPERLASLWGWCAAGLMVAFVLRGKEASARLEDLAAGSRLIERAYIFFELYEPLSSWWLFLLLAGTLVSITALLIWGLAGFADAGNFKGPALERPIRAGAVLVLLGTLLILLALCMERRLSISGEMLFRSGEETGEVRLPAPPGVDRRRSLGFTVSVESMEGDRIAAVASDEQVILRPDQPLVVKGIRLKLRDIRTVSETRRFRLSIADLDTMDTTIKKVSEGEVFEALPGINFVLLDHEKDLRGLGEAIRLQQLDLSLIEEGVLGDGEEPFWAFREYPDFDKNRGKPHAVVFVGSEPLEEAIVAAVYHPGLWPAVVGSALFLFGLLTLLARRYVPRSES